MLEVDRQAKRIEMLEETVKRKQYELDQVRDRLDRRENELNTSRGYIETLKVEINRQNNIIVDYMNTNASLRELAAEGKYRRALLSLAECGILPKPYKDETLTILGLKESEDEE